MSALLGLTGSEILILIGITFVAGLVRGFSGFALSAMVMASAVLILPPVELIPICWWLEMSASLLMARGGWRDADRGVVKGLVIGSAIGLPIGLALTQAVSVEVSALIALSLLIVLAASQLVKLRLPFLATPQGLYGSGLLAGIATGLASIGGMVVALYVLARDAPARQMRGSLVLFLFVSAVISLFTLLAFGVMDQQATVRGLAFIVPTMAGVLLGQRLFTPKYEPYYKPFCLSLLIGLACLALIRTLVA
ncbi:sulfite exporter TauE/SafE family protein [Cognatishimia sp. MH4019]|uniref:sulfite exporter TauE/SafE family protein n=1 Tax=Cognatishimia sp. MH4019 TaxID=2854030 RepID=UPI001CD30801|nr:sulfite exporter TauE/SafE family protein [Cognatishimia sp. MH4019]